jgi:hypothetical protein
MTKHTSETMKLNFMTDQGSNRATVRWACRALDPSLSARAALGRLGTTCGRGIRAVAACHALAREEARSGSGFAAGEATWDGYGAAE